MSIQRRRAVRAGAAAAALLCAYAPSNRRAHAQSADERAVAQAVEALTKAMIDVDRGRLAAVTPDQLRYGHSGGGVEKKRQFVDSVGSREGASRGINLSDKTISLVDNEAIVRHRFTAETASPSGQVTPV